MMRGVLCLWLLAGLGLAAEPVTLEGYLARVQAVHPLFRAERLALQLADAETAALRGAEGWVLQATPSLGTEEPVSNSSFSPSDSTTLGMGVDLERSLWRTGSRVGVNWDYLYQEQEAATVPIFGPNGELSDFETGLPEFHQHGLFLSFTQPLLKNRGGGQDRLAADVREITARAERLRSRENEEDFLLRLAGRYLEWRLQDQELLVAEDRAVLAQGQLDFIMRRRLENQAAQVDVLRARSDQNSVAQAVRRARLSRDAVAAELAVLAQWPAMPTAVDEDLFATNDLAMVGVNVPAGLRVLDIFEFEADRLLREAAGLVDSERAQLDLDLSAGLSGGDATFGESASLDQPSARAALVFRYPLGNRVAKKQVEINRLQREQVIAQMEQTAMQLASSIGVLETQLTQTIELLALSAAQIELARERTEEELEQYRQGRSSLAFVIQSQDAEATAEVLHLRTAVGFQKLRLEHEALLDRLLPSR